MAETEGIRMEELERKRDVSEGFTKSTTISNSGPVLVTESSSAPLREASTKEWLISITNESKEKISTAVAPKPQICKAPELLRKDEKSAESFDPKVVAIGPNHHGSPHLESAEDHKRAAALEFSSESRIHEFYDKVKNVAAEARACYADEYGPMTDEEFTLMLFFDGCFVLHFIDCYVNSDIKEVTMSTHLHGSIMRDIFLLENQLPFVVLKALMSLKSVDLDLFIRMIIGSKLKAYRRRRTPHHLLDLLRTNLLGPERWTPQGLGRACNMFPHILRGKFFGPGTADKRGDWPSFRAVKKLREVEIKFRRSKTNHLNDIRFSSGLVWGTLSLPSIVIDDLTRSRFLNMIALELSTCSVEEYGITSFVWFLDCLIDKPEDVKKLRAEGILINALGTDEKVADLINELAPNLVPSYEPYSRLLNEIAKHCNNKFKINMSLHMRTLRLTHFSNPWTAIAFFASVFLLVLTVIQAFFSVFPRR